MAELKDPVRDALLAELRTFRRLPGIPTIDRLSGMPELIEALGYGDVERAWARLERLREERGSDPKTDIGAYFHLAGWGIGKDTLDQRIKLYADDFSVEERTARRRGDRGAAKLTTIVRDQAESNRPWGLITVFQSGAKVDFIVRLMMAFESWRPAEIRLNGKDVSEPEFVLHKNPDVTGGFYYQLINEAVPLDMSVEPGDAMASLLIHWPMPVWPTWLVRTYGSSPGTANYLRTFRDRAVEVRIDKLVELVPLRSPELNAPLSQF